MDAMSAWIVVALIWTAWQVFAAVFWPFVPCPMWRCEKGKTRRPGKSKAWRACWWCGGDGRRLRLLRRLYDHLTRGKART